MTITGVKQLTKSLVRQVLASVPVLILCAASLYAVGSNAGSQLERSVVAGPLAPRDYWLFESGPVRPLAMSHAGNRLYVANIPDGSLEVFAITGLGLTYLGSVPVGLEPVALAVSPDDKRVWVVNHLSDSVSVVNVAAASPFVEQTLWVGDEPRDIVFAGPGQSRVFITSAHRGQNSLVDPSLRIRGTGRADVWVFDSKNTGEGPAGKPLAIVTLFGDSPRALAASPDGKRVYAAIFRSGNRTTTLPPAAIKGFPKPPPNDSDDGVLEPTTGIIVKFSNGVWQDELGRNYNNVVTLALPDLDVFEIDAMAEVPVELDAVASVGTTLFNMAVNPVSGALYVSNIEALNHVRFSGDSKRTNTSVNGNLTVDRISFIKDGQVNPRRLNKHLDLSEMPGDKQVLDTSLSLPMSLAINSDGETLYVAAYGSAKVAFYKTSELESDQHTSNQANHIELSGGGPAGLALDENHNRLYVLTRFDNSLSIIDLESRLEIEHLPLFSPEPESVTQGRKFLYDARLTSGFGNDSCGTCHLFGDNDALAWDLGDPDGTVQAITNKYAPLTANHPQLNFKFHPLKGPMTTQSMRGLPRHGPQHWRGDRTGTQISDGETLEEATFKEFNEAFTSLAAKPEQISEQDMQAFSDFAMQLTYPPNPIRKLDNTLTSTQQTGRDLYMNGVQRSNGNLEICVTCHTLNPKNGIFGTTGLMAFNDQPGEKDFKIPHFRDQYQKVGMFTSSINPLNEIRGYALNHNGATSINATFSEFGVPSSQTTALKEYLFAFPAETAPIMGQQLTLTTNSSKTAYERYQLLLQRARITAPFPECDLVISGPIDGRMRGWAYDRLTESFIPDIEVQDALDEASMESLIRKSDTPFTLTCTPWGSGKRIGIDRDGDSILDFEEVLQGSNPGSRESSTFRASSGLWLNLERSGSGLDLQHAGDVMALTWFTYAEDETPIWYQAVAPANKNWTADLLQMHWDPPAGKSVPLKVGVVSITFSDSLKARFDWQIKDKQGHEEIEKFRFSRLPTTLPFTGLWYDPEEPGYGVTIDSQGETRVIVVYFYDEQNQPRWVLIQQNNDLASTGKASSLTGPCPWCEFAPAVHSDGGSMSLDFSSLTTARADLKVFLKSQNNGLWQRDDVTLTRLTDEANQVPEF
jgi:YVTN family beta-propeller protein